VTMDFTMFEAPKNITVGDEIVLMVSGKEGISGPMRWRSL